MCRSGLVRFLNKIFERNKEQRLQERLWLMGKNPDMDKMRESLKAKDKKKGQK